MGNTLSKRIAQLQKRWGINTSGMLDLPTCDFLAQKLGLAVSENSLTLHISHLQAALRIDQDGIAGPETITALERLQNIETLKLSRNASLAIPTDKADFLITNAIPSKDVYERRYQSPYITGRHSGVMVGIGYDCGYASRKDIQDTWEPYLSSTELSALLKTHGKVGIDAKEVLHTVSEIKILYHTALHIFYTNILPGCALDVTKIYPGVTSLLPDCQLAILSLVYNRGPLIDDTPGREEMVALAGYITGKDYSAIAQHLRSMKRLWARDTKQHDLREQEAHLAEKARSLWRPENIIMF